MQPKCSERMGVAFRWQENSVKSSTKKEAELQASLIGGGVKVKLTEEPITTGGTGHVITTPRVPQEEGQVQKSQEINITERERRESGTHAVKTKRRRKRLALHSIKGKHNRRQNRHF